LGKPEDKIDIGFKTFKKASKFLSLTKPTALITHCMTSAGVKLQILVTLALTGISIVEVVAVIADNSFFRFGKISIKLILVTFDCRDAVGGSGCDEFSPRIVQVFSKK